VKGETDFMLNKESQKISIAKPTKKYCLNKSVNCPDLLGITMLRVFRLWNPLYWSQLRNWIGFFRNFSLEEYSAVNYIEEKDRNSMNFQKVFSPCPLG